MRWPRRPAVLAAWGWLRQRWPPGRSCFRPGAAAAGCHQLPAQSQTWRQKKQRNINRFLGFNREKIKQRKDIAYLKKEFLKLFIWKCSQEDAKLPTVLHALLLKTSLLVTKLKSKRWPANWFLLTAAYYRPLLFGQLAPTKQAAFPRGRPAPLRWTEPAVRAAANPTPSAAAVWRGPCGRRCSPYSDLVEEKKKCPVLHLQSPEQFFVQ